MQMNDITGAVVDEAIGIHRVEDLVIVELKSIDRLAPMHTKQLLTYMRLANLHVGLLLNFGAETMSKGIKRLVRNLPP